MKEIKNREMYQIVNSDESIENALSNKTSVVGWYLHQYDSFAGGSATIRGPWNRWISVHEGTDPKTHGNKDNCGVASPQADAEFIAVAMNNFERIYEENKQLKKEKALAIKSLQSLNNHLSNEEHVDSSWIKGEIELNARNDYRLSMENFKLEKDLKEVAALILSTGYTEENGKRVMDANEYIWIDAAVAILKKYHKRK